MFNGCYEYSFNLLSFAINFTSFRHSRCSTLHKWIEILFVLSFRWKLMVVASLLPAGVIHLSNGMLIFYFQCRNVLEIAFEIEIQMWEEREKFWVIYSGGIAGGLKKFWDWVLTELNFLFLKELRRTLNCQFVFELNKKFKFMNSVNSEFTWILN